MTGIVFDIKEMGVHDGPGLRTTVFLKGCPLRCVWCHNPEGLSREPQLSVREAGCLHCGLCRRGCSHPDCQPFGRCLHICPQGLISVSGREMTPQALAKKLLRNKPLYDMGGGVTFSGGEPLLQSEFLCRVLDELHGVSVAIEASGYADEDVFRRVVGGMDLVYMDIKLADPEQHRKFTGVSNEKILRNLEILRTSGKRCVIRTPLIPGITDTPENLTAIEALIDGLPWEQLPYNPLAGAKYAYLNMEFPYGKL